MTQTLLQVDNLSVRIGNGDSAIRPVDGVSFEIRRGETFALLGESGCGKSMTALALLRLLPQPAGEIVSGSVRLDGEELLALTESGMRAVRGGRIAMIFQEPMTSLNPVMTVGAQIAESLEQHKNLRGEAARQRVLELLDDVGIPDAARRFGEYPHQLSGGMKQRVMIAIALAGDPDLLIADEPTTALDVTIQAQVLDLMRKLQREHGMAVLLITHDLGVVSEMADRIAVMYAGQLVEQAPRDVFFGKARHPYSKKLFAALPDSSKREQRLTVIPGTVPPLNQVFYACRFAERCERAWELCNRQQPDWFAVDAEQGVRCHLADPTLSPPTSSDEQDAVAVARSQPSTAPPQTLLEVNGLKIHFPIQRGLFKRVVGQVRAVDGIDLAIPSGQTLALVGESGCGKTTVGKGILQLLNVTAGSVCFESVELTQLKGEALRSRRSDFQIIFQDPYSSMNPRMSVGDIIEEGMIAQRIGAGKAERRQRVAKLLEQVGLRPEHIHRYPHEFSGGQRQRICIARALAVNPKLIVCDEPTSALDVSVQAQILNLLQDLQNELGLSFLFITHDLSVVAYLADRIAVMYLGRIVEEGNVEDVLENPRHPYTEALLSAVPRVNDGDGRKIIRLEGDLPSPSNPPTGCHFHPRCRHAQAQCSAEYPPVSEVSGTHQVRCYLWDRQTGSVPPE
ncbi:MAG TPA: dipeptide ABC transporter ATP-binding protein [Gammaproteobacteria bacterium]|nr:dipeptide ABC transporter ATP-binding protein [Gammaproteobacteria bacterium]